MSFHVPESYRITTGPQASSAVWGNNGAFRIHSAMTTDRILWVIASDGEGWEHVSVHAEQKRGRQKIPQWEEMCQVKGMFWDAEDVVMQLHPARSEYVNMHPYTLHLWRPLAASIPVPPSILVGFKGVKVIQQAGQFLAMRQVDCA